MFYKCSTCLNKWLKKRGQWVLVSELESIAKLFLIFTVDVISTTRIVKDSKRDTLVHYYNHNFYWAIILGPWKTNTYTFYKIIIGSIATCSVKMLEYKNTYTYICLQRHRNTRIHTQSHTNTLGMKHFGFR